MILITSADQWLGYSIASHLMHHPSLQNKLRLAYQDKSNCHSFERNGAETMNIDYSNEDSLAQSVHGVQHVVLVIGFEANRVDICKKMIQRAHKSRVKSMIVVSHMGAMSATHDSLKQFSEIEEELFSTDIDAVVLRADWITQNFHLWSSYIERHRKLPMTISDDTHLCPIDLEDLCHIVQNMVLNDDGHIRCELDEQHVGQIYTLTGPKRISGKELVQLLADTTGYQKLTYHRTRRMDLSFYLQELGKDIWFDARVKREKAQMYQDDFVNYGYKSKVFSAPSGTQVEIYLDYFDYIQSNQGSMYTPHAELLAKRPCKTVDHFFKEHANSFKPRV
ncbi:hypothetical protein BGW37DRAFT_501448 [Umbelopsis sp. PMI_123]|nr:hypothetical protein BGW37DRAFT_501448 [Umbelopsis sp. PMI_123]